jgi:hypothetical protein
VQSTDPRYDAWLDAAALVNALHLGDEQAANVIRRTGDPELMDEALAGVMAGVLAALPAKLRVLLRAQLLADGLGDETPVAVERLVGMARPASSWTDYSVRE